MGRALTVVVSLLLLGGCRFTYDRQKIGDPARVQQARKLEAGATVQEVFDALGPPDLLVRVADVNRAYWTAWDDTWLRLLVQAYIPGGSGGTRLDALILTSGNEQLEMARLDFDRNWVLTGPPQVSSIPLSSRGLAVALDTNVIENLFDERRRRLQQVEGLDQYDDDDWDDWEADEAARKEAGGS